MTIPNELKLPSAGADEGQRKGADEFCQVRFVENCLPPGCWGAIERKKQGKLNPSDLD